MRLLPDGDDDHGGYAGIGDVKAFVVGHFERLINRGDISAIADNVRGDYVDHDGPGGKTGVAESRERTIASLRRLAILKVEVWDVVGDGDKVIVRNVCTAWDPDRGEDVEMRGVVMFRLQGGRLAERWAMITGAEPVRSATWDR